MLIVLSPAKALNFSAAPERAPLTLPELREDTAELAQTTRKLTARQLKRLMDLSDNLADLNRERFQAFDPEADDGMQAAFAFNGDVYAGLKARELDRKALAWAQDHIRILSGLYGLLRPLDAIQPYRLEMHSRLKTRRGRSLYDFWGPRIAEALNEAARGHKDPTLVNCASGEYFGAVDQKALKLPVIACRFLEERDGEAKMNSFFAKKARGLLARWAIDNRVDKAADLKGFEAEGYSFAQGLSGDAELTFTRPLPPPVALQRKLAAEAAR
jgi:cytoplasmic iron level regulating protein YaaA (DUF328/UPF0246 family)